MKFKSQEEYEKERSNWKLEGTRTRNKPGYEKFLEAEQEWMNRSSEYKSESGSKSGKKGSGMKIKFGKGKYYPGKTKKIKGKKTEFKGFDKIMSGEVLTDPGEKFSKKKNFKRAADAIEGKHYDKKGNLYIPKFKIPDRVKLSKEQRKANKKIDQQFDEQGFYKTDAIEMPAMNNLKDSRLEKYRAQGQELASRLGISMEKNTDKGVGILQRQAARYNKDTNALTIPDYSLDSAAGQEILKIGKKRLKTKGMKT